MPVHIDDPAPGMAFDPKHFLVRGWVWLETRHAGLAAVEVWSKGKQLGEGAEFTVRDDVSTKYALPPETRTAFRFFARNEAVGVDEQFELELRPRFADGSRGGAIFTSRVGPLPRERDPQAALRAAIGDSALGLEIGAHVQPVPGIAPFYTDSVADFAGTTGRVDFLSDGRALPLADGTLDYLCSSHVLEHLPDPLAALHEWHRVLRPGGWLYLIVPDKRFTFDAPRAVTTAAHLLDDFREGRTAATSLEHVDEFIYQTDWSVLHQEIPISERPARQLAARNRYLHDIRHGLPIDIHFHTFTPDSLREVLTAAGFLGDNQPRFEIVSQAERYPPERADGIALLLRRTATQPPPVHPAATFTFADNRTPGRKLPLVCPVTLEPLRCEVSPGGDTELVSNSGQMRYSFRSARPALLPRDGVMPMRPWTRPSSQTGSKPPMPSLAQAFIDVPAAGSTVDPLNFIVRGWAWLETAQANVRAVEVWDDDRLLGRTLALYERPDVTAALSLPPSTNVGFDMSCHHPSAVLGGELKFEVHARLADGTRSAPLARQTVTTIARDYRQNHFGVLLDERTTALQRRPQVYSEGPSQYEPSAEILMLLQRYFGPPPRRVLDVGCGVAAYGRRLLAHGYDWMGVEVDAADAAVLARDNLPHRLTDGGVLPFADGSFDAAMCIDVLEHIERPAEFLQEVRRVAPRQLVVSVPNCELLGYLWDHLATPWHMLESDHKNFFTRWSLGALLRPHYEEVELRFHGPYPLRTIEGTPLHYHLFAVATNRG